MRTTYFFLNSLFILTFLFVSCRSAQKYVESGDYDGAIQFCVNKLEGKRKKKTEHVKGLEMAFQKAQARDLAACQNLQAANRSENWERINDIHRQIARRQRLVEPLLPLSAHDGYRAQIDLLDIASLERESRSKAADFIYTHAQQLLARAEFGDKNAARDAYRELLKVERDYFRHYRDMAILKEKARNLGTAHVLFTIQNASNQVLPVGFNERILAFSRHDLDSEWKRYYFEPAAGLKFDYKVVFNVRDIDISPERVHERTYVDEKEIQDGWDYVLDVRGNVKKDSLGNDIKHPRYVRIRAQVLEIHQSKAARLTAFIEMIDLTRNAVVDTRTLGAEVLFENYASTFTGDERALSQDSRCRIGNRPQPFPFDSDMLAEAADRIKPDLHRELRNNDGILR